MRVAPSQQVSVNPVLQGGQSGMSGLASKIDEKREAAKIKKLPAKQRPAARKKLKEVLKAREDKVKKQLPTKIETPGQLRQLMTSFRTLKV